MMLNDRESSEALNAIEIDEIDYRSSFRTTSCGGQSLGPSVGAQLAYPKGTAIELEPRLSALAPSPTMAEGLLMTMVRPGY